LHGRINGPDVREPVRAHLAEAGSQRLGSSALTAPISQSFISQLENVAKTEGIDVITFKKGQSQEPWRPKALP